MATTSKPRDRTALVFLGVTLLVLAVGVALLLRALMTEREPEPAKRPPELRLPAALAGLIAELKDGVGSLEDLADLLGLGPRAETAVEPRPGGAAGRTHPERAYAPLDQPPAAPHTRPLPANAAWTYDVFFGPSWNAAGRLEYRLPGGLPQRPTMAWTPNGGQTQVWILGTFQAGHASHGQTRFPGFFMHPAYFPRMLANGTKLAWEIPWQQSDAALRPGRVRRYHMTVAGWESVRVPAGELQAARLDGTLSYVDGGKVLATVRYTLWYSPQARQAVRVKWMGKAPDESSTEMIAELSGYRGI